MVCEHLKNLYLLCDDGVARIGRSDLIRRVCGECRQEETCPSVSLDEYDARQSNKVKLSVTRFRTVSEPRYE